MKPVKRRAGKGRQVIGYKVEWKFPEKIAAREQAMKHLGLYERHNKQKPFYVPASRRRGRCRDCKEADPDFG